MNETATMTAAIAFVGLLVIFLVALDRWTPRAK